VAAQHQDGCERAQQDSVPALIVVVSAAILRVSIALGVYAALINLLVWYQPIMEMAYGHTPAFKVTYAVWFVVVWGVATGALTGLAIASMRRRSPGRLSAAVAFVAGLFLTSAVCLVLHRGIVDEKFMHDAVSGMHPYAVYSYSAMYMNMNAIGALTPNFIAVALSVIYAFYTPPSSLALSTSDNRGGSLRLSSSAGKSIRPHLTLASLIVVAISLSGLVAVIIWEWRQQEALGELHFPISCSADSRRLFEFATSRLHSLNFKEAERAYSTIAQAEPDCAIAYWGIAMSRLGRPVPGLRASDDLDAGRAALRTAAHAATADPRERAYIGALTALFGEDDAHWANHTVAYEKAMAALAARYPDDTEAAIFYALALNIEEPSSDKSFEKETKAAELLLVALSLQPRHPGLAHYLTYCLHQQTTEIADSPSLSVYRTVSLVQSGLAALALIGISAFFFAGLPRWSWVQRA